ncbi:MAG: undecaprenyldiphospho-muramoylpentapeptide beta-N-acetylglucosaminyltransferase [Bacillota bacterium]|nr:undecaprenyldiphospho-muramoylpentapeptide beta-N-acetylglucosaminyltransferase [Bacillota bacterium]
MSGYAIVTGGGTAGHINPAIAIAKALQEDGYEVLYVGSDGEDCLDRELVERSGLPFMGLKITTPLLKASWQTVVSIVSIMKATRMCRRMMKKKRPSLVVGTGGFVSIPVLNAALSLKIKTAVHEQNVYPGITNRRLSKKVDRVFMTFSESLKYLGCPEEKAVLSGIPLVRRPQARSLAEYAEGLQDGMRVLVSGGSLGSRRLNEVVIEASAGLAKQETGIRIKLSCGKNYYERLKTTDIPNLEIVPYIFDMPAELNRADLMVCRAGSSTVFEGIVSELPAIVVPSPNVAGDHQRPNARYWQSLGAAIYVEEDELTGDTLADMLLRLYRNKNELLKMKESATKVDTPCAIDVIIKELKKL